MNIVILGSAYPYRAGGITSSNERLARQFQMEGHRVTIYNFSYFYPKFLFPGSTQYATGPAPADLTIERRIHSINPINWLLTGNRLKKLRPDMVVVRYWLPVMAPALGTIIRQVKKNHYTKVICVVDNIIPHEKRPADVLLTRYFVKAVDGFVTMSDKVMKDLKAFAPQKPALQAPLPLFDNFGAAVPLKEARERLNIPLDKKVILFFGFIRPYKGLDILLDAIPVLKQEMKEPFTVVVAGEIYGSAEPYLQQVEKNGIADVVDLRTRFIPDEEVRYYICAADVIVQPYRTATQSAISPLAYHFEVPMVVTNVGGLPDYVPDGKVGFIAEPNPASLAQKIVAFFEKGKAYFLPGLQEEKKKYTWNKLTEAVYALYKSDSILNDISEISYANMLHSIEQKLGKPPRNIRFKQNADWYKFDPPDWDWKKDTISTTIHKWKQVFIDGKLGWGQIVQVNSLLFEAGKANCPGEVMVWEDTDTPFDPEIAEEIAHQLYELKGNSVNLTDEEEKDFAERLEDELSRDYGVQVPARIANGLNLFTSVVFFQRHHIPHGILTKSFFPVLYLTSDPKVVVMVPYPLWPTGFLDEWLSI